MTPPATVAEELGRGLRRVMVATVVLYLIVLAVVVWHDWQDTNARAELRHEEQRTTTALCALRAGLDRSIKTGDQFLASHPDGISGIPATTLRRTIENQRRSRHALATIRCR